MLISLFLYFLHFVWSLVADAYRPLNGLKVREVDTLFESLQEDAAYVVDIMRIVLRIKLKTIDS